MSSCSSPTSSGTTERCTAKYGAMNTPLSATSASSSGNERRPVACRIGMAARSGARARSQTSIVRRVPMRAAIAPPQKPSIAIGTISAMITQVMRCGEPVVRSTNHGSASHVICVPSEEATSAASSAETRRSRSRLTARRRRRRTRRSDACPCARGRETRRATPRTARRALRAPTVSARGLPMRSALPGASVGELVLAA